MSDYQYITYETSGDGAIATVTLNRPRQRNAQNRGLLVELGSAMQEAERDDAVRVVVLQAAGDTFSSGHDLGSSARVAEQQPGAGQHESYQGYGATLEGIESLWRQEWHFFFSNTLAWRNLRKITIAAVQGEVFSAGLMLAWACDLIVADETAVFADVVATRLGMCGVEYLAHPWEFGVRKAKELMLTGDSISADDAYRLGMVSRVFPRGELRQRSQEFARRVAGLPSAAALMIKEAVNQTQDNQGFYNSLKAAFSLHELNHAHWGVVSKGTAVAQTAELGGIAWREAGPVMPAQKSTVKADQPADPRSRR